MTKEYRKQIEQAEFLGDKELERHASVGRICKCNDCFCCAAEHVQGLRELYARNDRRLKRI